MRMPLKICPRVGHILRNRRTQAYQTNIMAPISLHFSGFETSGPEMGFGNSHGTRLLLLGAFLGAGFSASGADLSIFRTAECEGAESLLVDDKMNGFSPYNLLEKFRSFSDWARKRIFFMYERRIRAYSSPEKIFEYFASTKISNQKFYMSPADLMRAIIPVMPPSESSTIRGGYLFGEKYPGELQCATSEFFMMFDTDADGRISFEEFNFIRTLLITSLESFDATFKMFDRNGDGMIELAEFLKVMQLMREKNKEKISQSGTLLPSRKSLDSFENIKLLKHLFGNDGKAVLEYRDFIQFLKDLHDEILKLEFAHYDCKQQGSIPVQDFGSSLVSAASLSNISKYLRRVDALADDSRFKGARISFKDFEQVSRLRRKRKLLALSSYAVNGKNGLSKSDFKWAAAQVCGVYLSDTAVDVIFYIFDSNGDGMLSVSEFLGVQDLRDIANIDAMQPGVLRMIQCMWACARENCIRV